MPAASLIILDEFVNYGKTRIARIGPKGIYDEEVDELEEVGSTYLEHFKILYEEYVIRESAKEFGLI